MKRFIILVVLLAASYAGTPPAVAEEAQSDSLAQSSSLSAGPQTVPELAAGWPDSAHAARLVDTDVLTPGIELPDTYGLLLRTLLSLFAVIALIWGAVQVMKRLSPESSGSGNRGQIRVLERAFLAPKRAVYVVQVGGKALALGVTDQQVTTLTELDLEEMLEAYPPPGGSRTAAFASVFDSVKARFDGKQVAN